jgi:phosphopantothenoylcysteine decarboxylase / phosphopantothenate---cysteine ligase
MKILITAGPTYEPIDPVRFIGNRSSGRMGVALATAGIAAGHDVTAILGPVSVELPARAQRIDIETAREMFDAVLREFPRHDVLIMAAAVADYRPKAVQPEKMARSGSLTIELEATKDIVKAAAAMKRADQRVIGFSLEQAGNLERARQKMARKNLDLIVYNPTETMNSLTIESTLLYPDGRAENLPCRSKGEFADILLQRAGALFGG